MPREATGFLREFCLNTGKPQKLIQGAQPCNYLGMGIIVLIVFLFLPKLLIDPVLQWLKKVFLFFIYKVYILK